jgi:hypothetical protein
LPRILAAALAAALITVPLDSQSSPGPGPAGDWQEAPAYVPLFAPAGPRASAYHIYVSRLSIDAVLERLARDPSLLHPPGSWSTSAQLPGDAFGQTGGYDRSKLARLYGSKRAVVARGPRGPASRPSEAWTLVSPYPSTDLARLEPGTLLIVLDLAGN